MCWQKTNSGECTWQKSQALAFIECAAQIYAAVCTHLTFVSAPISHSLTEPPLLHSRFYSLIKPQARLCIRKPHSWVTIVHASGVRQTRAQEARRQHLRHQRLSSWAAL